MFNKKEIGKIGEEIASKHIIDRGYVVLERNYRTRYGELDIIAKENNYLVFIEVKARKGTEFGYPREAVDWYKQSRIKNIASLYIAKKKLHNSKIRFDVVEVVLDEKNRAKSVVIIKNAFE
jgi:putative endonuclease